MRKRSLFSWFKSRITFSSLRRSSFFLPLRIPFSLFLRRCTLFIDLIAFKLLEMLIFLFSARRAIFFLFLPMYALLILLFKFFTLFIFLTFTLKLRLSLFSSRALRIRSDRRFFSPERPPVFLAFSRRVFILRGFKLKFFMIVSMSSGLSLSSSVIYFRSDNSFSFLKFPSNFDAKFVTFSGVIVV